MTVTAAEIDLGLQAVEAVIAWFNQRRALAQQQNDITPEQLDAADARFAKIVADPLLGVPPPPPPPPPPIPEIYFSPYPRTITAGESSVLSWSVRNASKVSIHNIGDQPLEGTIPVKPATTTDYTLTAVSADGLSASARVEVTVLPAVVVPPPSGAIYDEWLPAGSAKPGKPPYETGDHIYNDNADLASGLWQVARKEITPMSFDRLHYIGDVE